MTEPEGADARRADPRHSGGGGRTASGADGDTACLTAGQLPRLLDRIHARLRERREELDDLNVFPVPDADTGSNLVATVRSALGAVEQADRDLPAAASRGALQGACGNSGVILSQVVCALTDALEAGTVGPAELTGALVRARDLAYEAVADPVEGTMLSVLAAVADRIAELRGGSLAELTDAVLDAAAAAVARTPEQLEPLRRAGVVDAGARGLHVVLAGLDEHVTGRVRELPPAPRGDVEDRRLPVVEREAGSEAYDFEVQYLLEADEQVAVAERLRTRLRRLGDSVVVVASGGLLRVHVHTNRVGAAVAAGEREGIPTDVEIARFEEADPGREAAGRSTERAAVGLVVVLPVPGLRDIAGQVGAATVPGDDAPPTVATLLNAAGQLDADRVVALPGRADAIPVARRAAAVSVAEGGRRIEVVEPAVGAPAVLAALAVFDPAATPGRAVTDLAAAAGAVTTGRVVPAGGRQGPGTGAGGWLGRVDGQDVGRGEDPLEALEELLRCCPAGAEVVTLVTGVEIDGRTAAEAERRAGEVTGAEVVVVEGGQSDAAFVVGFE